MNTATASLLLESCQYPQPLLAQEYASALRDAVEYQYALEVEDQMHWRIQQMLSKDHGRQVKDAGYFNINTHLHIRGIAAEPLSDKALIEVRKEFDQLGENVSNMSLKLIQEVDVGTVLTHFDIARITQCKPSLISSLIHDLCRHGCIVRQTNRKETYVVTGRIHYNYLSPRLRRKVAERLCRRVASNNPDPGNWGLFPIPLSASATSDEISEIVKSQKLEQITGLQQNHTAKHLPNYGRSFLVLPDRTGLSEILEHERGSLRSSHCNDNLRGLVYMAFGQLQDDDPLIHLDVSCAALDSASAQKFENSVPENFKRLQQYILNRQFRSPEASQAGIQNYVAVQITGALNLSLSN